MNFILFLLFGAGMFALSFISYNKYHNTTLYALAIGGVVNANYFHSGNYPIDCFGLPFGIDSLIYTLFAFCVIFMLLNDSRRSAYLLAISSIIAIIFSACMELAAKLLAGGEVWSAWEIFESFIFSALSSSIAVVVTVEFINKLKNKCSPYVCMILGIGIVAIVRSGIYYPVTAVINGTTKNLWDYVFSSFTGNGVALVYGLLALKILNRLKKKNR